MGDRLQYYTDVRGAKDATLWLEDEEVFVGKVVAEYECMVHSCFCEAEFAFYAAGTLLKAEPRNAKLALKGCWRTERRSSSSLKHPCHHRIGVLRQSCPRALQILQQNTNSIFVPIVCIGYLSELSISFTCLRFKQRCL